MWILFLGLAAVLSTEPDLGAHMQRHFSVATQIQGAIVDADIDRAREFAAQLAEHDPPAGLPVGWQTFVADLKSLAGQARDAPNLTAAANAVAGMAGVCGACHQEFSVNTWLSSSSAEPLGETAKARMARHRWAADRLWEGLIGPLDEAWQQGAEGLAETPLRSESLLGEEQVHADILANQVYRLGGDARRAASAEDRVRVYGRLLSMCAECHLLFRAGD